jgi:hypothetical protein
LAHHRPFQVIGYHGCDRKIGLGVLNGELELKPSTNKWDWLGHGVYFWEQNPKRALTYAIEAAIKKQHHSGKIDTPFVIGAIIELNNCLNLIEPESIEVLKEAYNGLALIYEEAGQVMPTNRDAVRKLDNAVFKHLHEARKGNPLLEYDTVRCAFSEGEEVYPGANFTTRLHIELCVLNPKCYRGFFLPLPHEDYNPYLKAEFTPPNIG